MDCNPRGVSCPSRLATCMSRPNKVKTPWRLRFIVGLCIAVHRSTLPVFASEMGHCWARCRWDSISTRALHNSDEPRLIGFASHCNERTSGAPPSLAEEHEVGDGVEGMERILLPGKQVL